MQDAETSVQAATTELRLAPEGRITRILALLIVVSAAAALLSGCSLIDRFRGEPAAPQVPELSESSLNRLLLSAGEINDIVDGPGMEASTETADDLGRGPQDVSNEGCLGASFPALQPVYSGSGWTATQRGSVIDSEGNHGVLQAVVLFRTAERAREFFDTSGTTFETCVGEDIEIARGTEDEATITIGRVVDTDGSDPAVIAHGLEKFDGSLDCQHAMGVVSNLVAEAEVCFSEDAVADEAETIVTRILANAENVAEEEPS